MANLQGRNEANKNAHQSIANTIANALGATYLQPAQKHACGYQPLTQNDNRSARCLIPILPHALGFCPDHDDIHFTYVADMSFRTFWEHMLEELDLDIEVVSTLNDCSYAMFLKDINALRGLRLSGLSDVRLILTYSPRPENFNSLTNYQISHSCLEERSDLAKIFDQQSLSRKIFAKANESEDESEQMHSYLLYHSGFLLFHQWALSVGLISSEMNMMSTECLLMVYSEFFCSQPYSQRLDASGLLRRFLLSSFVEGLSSPELSSNNMSVLAPSGRELTARMTPETFQAVRTAVSCAVVGSQFDLTATDGLKTFATTYKFFVKISARCWDVDKRSEFYATIPDTLLALQNHVRRSGKDFVAARIWPHNLIDADEEKEGHVTYLLAIYPVSDGPNKLNIQIVEGIVSYFIGKLRFDHESSYIGHEVLDDSTLAALLPSLRHSASANTTSALADKAIQLKPTGGKFRTAAAVMNRLRWDPHHSTTEYEIGYVDRFEKELMWKSLKKWEQYTENEDFIPEHRVWKMRRKEDRKVVWDREARWDGTDEES